MNPRPTIRTAWAVALLAFAATTTWAQTTALTVYNGFNPHEPELLSIDLATGGLTPIGSLGPADMPDLWALAFLPSGALVGVDRDCTVFFDIDAVTGEATIVGSLGIEHPVPTSVGDLAADACGRLWMVCSTVGPKEERVASLYRINPATGAAVLRGPLAGPMEGIAAAGDLLYGLDSEFLGIPRLMRLNPETLVMTEIGTVEDLFGWLGGAPDFRDGGELLLFGVFDSGFPPPSPRMVAGVSLSGELTSAPVAVPHPGSLTGLAVAPPAGECLGGSALVIPTASTWGQVALALLLAAGSILVLRRS